MTVIFARINFRLATVNRFRAFAKIYGETHSDTLDAMMGFFEQYKINPFGELATDLNSLEINLRRRINSMIAIIKDIEKHQTKPTKAMIQLLFEHSPQKTRQPKLVEVTHKDKAKTDDFFKSALETIELESQYTELQRQHADTKADFKDLIQKVQVIKGGFGKIRLQLDMNLKEFEALKITYKID